MEIINANKHWTDEQKQYVRDVWGELPVNRIAKNIGKSFTAITKFAERDKLGGAIYNDLYLTSQECADLISVNQTSILTWIKTGQLKAKKQTMRRKKVFLVDPDDFRNFLRNNQDKWNATRLQSGFFDLEVDWLIKKLDRDSQPTERKLGTSWTTKEERRLLDLVEQGFQNKDIALKLDRTEKSVANKRTRLMRERNTNE